MRCHTLGPTVDVYAGVSRTVPLAGLAGVDPQAVLEGDRGAESSPASHSKSVPPGCTGSYLGKTRRPAPPTWTTPSLDFRPRGGLYVLEITHGGLLADKPDDGVLVRFGPNGELEVVLDGFNFPTRLTIRGSTAYITDCGTCVDGGQVLRVPL